MNKILFLLLKRSPRTAYEYPASKKKFYTGYFFEGQGTSEVLNNNIKVILYDQGGHSDFFEINLELFRTFRGLLFLEEIIERFTRLSLKCTEFYLQFHFIPFNFFFYLKCRIQIGSPCWQCRASSVLRGRFLGVNGVERPHSYPTTAEMHRSRPYDEIF